MIYAEFYTMSTGYFGPKAPIPALGSDGVMIMDGRWGKTRRIREVINRANRLNTNLGKGFIGFKFMSGKSFLDSRPFEDGKLYRIDTDG